MEGDKTTLLARFSRETSYCSPRTYEKIGGTRFGTLAIFMFLDFLLPVRRLIFLSTSGMLVPISHVFLLHEMRERDRVNAINPIALAVAIVTVCHVDKIVKSYVWNLDKEPRRATSMDKRCC